MADETLVAIFWDRVARYEDRVAQKVKRDGRWIDISWREYREIVREIALGLVTLGCRKGTAIALLSQSRAEWAQCDFGILSAGGVTIPIYHSYPPDQIAYIVNDSGASFLIVENQVQLDKARQALSEMPDLDWLILVEGDPGDDPFVLSLEGVRAVGREQAEDLEGALEERKGSIVPDDTATIVYTSGTTGPPKGVIQTHGNHAAMLRSVSERAHVSKSDTHLLFLPLAHTFARLESYVGVYLGLTTAFAESVDKVPENLREVSPTFIYSVPRVFEKVYARILGQIEAAPPFRQKIVRWALGVGRQVSQHQQAKRWIPLGLRLKHALAHRLVFHKIHQALGGRLRFCASGGAPLSREIAEFFHAIGILILEGYGLTECCPVLTANDLENFKFGTVGRVVPGVELRIAPDGEILARGPNIAKGYLNKPEATVEVFDAEGWFHTGDVGILDRDGFLTITDRKKDLIVTAGGINVAPQNVENVLKTHPLISQAMVYGDRRPYPVALIALNPEELSAWAKEHGLETLDPAALTQHEEIRTIVARIIEEKNASLPSYAQVKKFAIVPEDFTQDGGELTPTLKLKRKVVAEKYRDLLESLYVSREGFADSAPGPGAPSETLAGVAGPESEPAERESPAALEPAQQAEGDLEEVSPPAGHVSVAAGAERSKPDLAGVPMTLFDTFRLDGKVAIVTGASRGLGKAMALALAEVGADLVLVSRSKSDLDAAAKEIESLGRRTLVIPVDISAFHDAQAIAQETLATFNQIDILVNNAGVAVVKPLVELVPDEWETVLATNLTGTYNLCRAVAPHLIQQRAGKVINIASVLGVAGLPGYAAYSASKGGIIALTRVLAVEWARFNIQVNCIAPGWFVTPMNEQAFTDEKIRERLLRGIPARRTGRPEELGPLVVYLASSASDYLTGEVIFIDGGAHAA